MTSQRGGFVLGMVVGLLIGLAVALGVALYITKAPIPFINKVPQRTAEQDSAETERNRHWDPNAPLGGKAGARAAAAASAASAALSLSAATAAEAPGSAAAPLNTTTLPSVPAATRPATRDPLAILSGEAVLAPAAPARPAAPVVAEPFIYFVQAGAFTRTEDAEQQRARLAIIGHAARITEREQAGRTVYRVRLGPYPTRDEADALQMKLQDSAIETQIVRVEKP